MSDIKIRLSLVIPGATMLSSQDCEKMSKKDAYDQHTLSIVSTKKEGKKIKKQRETLLIHTRKTIPARQAISISQEAYDYMVNSKEIPSAKLARKWGHMSNKEKLKYHFDLIAESLGAISYSYEILDN